MRGTRIEFPRVALRAAEPHRFRAEPAIPFECRYAVEKDCHGRTIPRKQCSFSDNFHVLTWCYIYLNPCWESVGPIRNSREWTSLEKSRIARDKKNPLHRGNRQATIAGRLRHGTNRSRSRQASPWHRNPVHVPSPALLQPESAHRGQKSTICEDESWALCPCEQCGRARPGIMQTPIAGTAPDAFESLAFRSFLSLEAASLVSLAHDARYS